jgi:hypothetical protein
MSLANIIVDDKVHEKFNTILKQYIYDDPDFIYYSMNNQSEEYMKSNKVSICNFFDALTTNNKEYNSNDFTINFAILVAQLDEDNSRKNKLFESFNQNFKNRVYQILLENNSNKNHELLISIFRN